MTVFSDTAVQGPARTLPERLMRMAGRTPVHIGLVIIALVWLVPTIGLLVTSGPVTDSVSRRAKRWPGAGRN